MEPTKALEKIQKSLEIAANLARDFSAAGIRAQQKAGGDPFTEADIAIDRVLKDVLLESGQGWLSEETADDQNRLGCSQVWIVDPLDGTREFIEGLPEWCISIALAQDGIPIAAGICNPTKEQLFLGSIQTPVTLNGKTVRVSDKETLENAKILASRSEVRKGRWDQFKSAPFHIIPCGSVAYKLACVSAGLADATFTLTPKNEWDVAAGICLVNAAGGLATLINTEKRTFNQKNTLLPGLVAGGCVLHNILCQFLKK